MSRRRRQHHPRALEGFRTVASRWHVLRLPIRGRGLCPGAVGRQCSRLAGGDHDDTAPSSGSHREYSPILVGENQLRSGAASRNANHPTARTGAPQATDRSSDREGRQAKRNGQLRSPTPTTMEPRSPCSWRSERPVRIMHSGRTWSIALKPESDHSGIAVIFAVAERQQEGQDEGKVRTRR